ncbi:hypothetical protein INS49_011960 [Diaporthe citri]|uniref:uncharacterized protein n=1 Tax=Diaporthe citri TaxID=83186 RepID=UPI001C7E68C6|nr:uncharacterized protein INS49_011960 [Diaporthe citri]KAG6360892.1 hypothetical protein INS49_011960 [Diaporthe citri]
MSHYDTPPHLQPMPRALRDHAQRLRQEYKSNFQNEIRHRKEISRILRAEDLSEARFGDHWKWINNKLRGGKWTMRDLTRACIVIKKLPQFGLHHSLIEKPYMVKIVGNPKHLEADAWSERSAGTRGNIEADAPANADAGRKKNTTVTNSSLGLFNTENRRDDTSRENPGVNGPQLLLRFPDGDRPFPKFLVCPSARERANLSEPARVLAISGMIAQLPQTIRHTLRETIIGQIKQADLRKRPSGLPFMNRIKKASKTKEDKVSLVDVVQGLAHTHWKAGENGAYSFFYESLLSMGIEAVADYDFDWSNIHGTNVLDGEGKELRITTSIPPIGRKVAARFRKRFEDTKEGKRLLADKTKF